MKSKLILTFGLILAVLSGCGETDPNNETNARVMVWNFVEGKLKDPSSAKFGTCRMEKTSRGSWETDCYVDAKNSFGGNERINFHCEVKHKSGDKWELVELSFK
jgi:hypothetical protein